MDQYVFVYIHYGPVSSILIQSEKSINRYWDILCEHSNFIVIFSSGKKEKLFVTLFYIVWPSLHE